MTPENKVAHYEYLIRMRGHAKGVPRSHFLRPQPDADYLFFWDAFWELSTARSVNFGVGPIPFPALLAFAQMCELDREGTEALRRIIRAMDAVFLEIANTKPESD